MSSKQKVVRGVVRKFVRDKGVNISKCPSNKNLATKAEILLGLDAPQQDEPFSGERGRLFRCYAEITGKNMPQEPRSVTRSTPDWEKRKAFYKTQEWKNARYDALKAGSGKCELCGASAQDGEKLNVDHIKSLKTHWHLRLDQSNLQVLCGSCNQGKGNRDNTDWR